MKPFAKALSLVAALTLCAAPAFAQRGGGGAPPATSSSGGGNSDLLDLPPLPPEAHVAQVTHVAGKTLNYTATVGALPVLDERGRKVAEVVYTAYTLDGPRDPRRPVTFAFNGGPGAASVYLNLGAIGPKRVQFGAAGDSPSDATGMVDNAGTWLDFTDLVFIDPVGTGFSHAFLPDDQAKGRFFTVKGDIDYLSRIVFDWLVKNERMGSPKYVVGESYGGFRAPRIAHTLQTDLGVGVSGVTMVSPFLDAASWSGGDFSPMPWVVLLPSMTASNLERHGKLTPEAISEVEQYARTEYVTTLLSGWRDQAALDRMVAKVADYTGLDPNLVKHWGGRIDSRTYLRELYRDSGKLGSWYDPNVTSTDPFPWSASQRVNDPILDQIIAPTTSAMVDFDTRVVGWKVQGRYEPLNPKVGRLWEPGWAQTAESVSDLRGALAVDPKMRVLILHGYDDLSCPFFVSQLAIDQIPPSVKGDASRLQLHLYPGGHMFYSRPDSQAQMRRDVMAMYGAR
jgi:carboxypeptidase C (cathepsin A)